MAKLVGRENSAHFIEIGIRNMSLDTWRAALLLCVAWCGLGQATSDDAFTYISYGDVVEHLQALEVMYPDLVEVRTGRDSVGKEHGTRHGAVLTTGCPWLC